MSPSSSKCLSSGYIVDAANLLQISLNRPKDLHSHVIHGRRRHLLGLGRRFLG